MKTERKNITKKKKNESGSQQKTAKKAPPKEKLAKRVKLVCKESNQRKGEKAGFEKASKKTCQWGEYHAETPAKKKSFPVALTGAGSQRAKNKHKEQTERKRVQTDEW